MSLEAAAEVAPGGSSGGGEAAPGGDVDRWIEIAKDCKYLPENDLKVTLNFIVLTAVRLVRAWRETNHSCIM